MENLSHCGLGSGVSTHKNGSLFFFPPLPHLSKKKEKKKNTSLSMSVFHESHFWGKLTAETNPRAKRGARLGEATGGNSALLRMYEHHSTTHARYLFYTAPPQTAAERLFNTIRSCTHLTELHFFGTSSWHTVQDFCFFLIFLHFVAY